MVEKHPNLYERGAILIWHKGRSLRVVVDEEDMPLVSRFQWCIGNVGRRNDHLTVMRTSREDGRQRTIILSRFLLNPADGMVIDHIDRNPLNNVRANLRCIPQGANAQNASPRRDNPIGMRGVTAVRGRYRARAQLNGASVHVGYFATAAEANDAVTTWRRTNMLYSTEVH